MRESSVITSGLSQNILVGGKTFLVEIYRQDADVNWSLKIQSDTGISRIWERSFLDDAWALIAAQMEIWGKGSRLFSARLAP